MPRPSSRPATATSSRCASSRTPRATSSTRPRASATTATSCRPSKAPINEQSRRFENIFRSLRKAKVKRANLYLAWDFTVSSTENIAQRLLHIRDDAFAQLGDTDLADGVAQGTAPGFTIDPGGVTEFLPCGADGCQDGEDDQIQRRIDGTFTVPCYLTNGCQPPATFALDSAGNPTRQGNYTANFVCIVPRADPRRPGRRGRRAGLALRPRAARQRRRDRLGTAEEPRPNPRVRLLRQRCDRLLGARRPEHDRHPPGPRPLSRAHRSGPAGLCSTSSCSGG